LRRAKFEGESSELPQHSANGCNELEIGGEEHIMDRMDQDRVGDKLDPLWAEYRSACPDVEPSAHFMPQLWQRIEAQRSAVASSWFRLWAEVWVVATVTLAIVMGAVLIPRFQTNPPAYLASYVDVLAAADSANDSMMLPSGETE
jgi:anti-sigma-K factor RskA